MNLKTFLLPFGIISLSLVLFCITSCNLLKNQVDKVDVEAFLRKSQPTVDSLSIRAGRYATIGASEKAQLVSKSLIQGLKGTMDTLDPDFRKLMRTIDSLGRLSDAQLTKLGENLDARLNGLKASIKDEELTRFLLGTVESLTGKLHKDTKYLLSDMIQATLDSMGTGPSKEKIRAIINSVLGEDTKNKAQALVQGALQPTMDTLLARIDKIVHKDVPFVQRQANKLLALLALLAAGIIGFVWYQRRRYAKLLSILTYQIDKLPSQEVYDDLTKKIRNEAQKTGLEPLLRETLKDQGINT